MNDLQRRIRQQNEEADRIIATKKSVRNDSKNMRAAGE